MIDVTEAHLCQERKAEVSEDTPLSEDTGSDPTILCLICRIFFVAVNLFSLKLLNYRFINNILLNTQNGPDHTIFLQIFRGNMPLDPITGVCR